MGRPVPFPIQTDLSAIHADVARLTNLFEGIPHNRLSDARSLCTAFLDDLSLHIVVGDLVATPNTWKLRPVIADGVFQDLLVALGAMYE